MSEHMLVQAKHVYIAPQSRNYDTLPALSVDLWEQCNAKTKKCSSFSKPFINLNKGQFYALLEDVQSIFEEPRVSVKDVTQANDDLEDFYSDES